MRDRSEIVSDKVARPFGIFSQGMKAGNLIFVSGQVAKNAAGEVVGKDDIRIQTRQCIENLKYVLVSIPRPEVPYWNVIGWAWSNTLGRKWRGQHGRLREAELDLLASGYGLVKEKRKRFFLGCISMTLYRVGKE